MKKGDRYFQFCPIAKAVELIGERWTLLVLRELLAGSQRFNDLRRGVPRMSQSLLSQRLKMLETAGLVVRREAARGKAAEYGVTPAALELRPVIESIGAWGYRFAQKAVTPDDLDASLLAWDMRRRIRADRFPQSPLVIHFHYVDAPRDYRHIWLVWEEGSVDMCLDNPGRPENVQVTTDLRTMTLIWLGDASCENAVRSGHMRLEGAPPLCRAFPHWLEHGKYAGVKRPGGRIPLGRVRISSRAPLSPE